MVEHSWKMFRPFESDPSAMQTFSVVATKEDIVVLLRRAARDLDTLESSLMRGGEAVSFAAASRAVHLALVELGPSA